MKKIIQRLSPKKIVFGLTGFAAFCLGIVFICISNHLAGKLDTQKMAQRWAPKGGASQVSCFFSRDANFTEESILYFEHALDKALEEASIVSESENESARLWADAYSATGKVTIMSNKASIEVSAVGVGGDFFLFHPLKLLTGSYFSGSDVMQDYIVIDEDAAWQLFGSNDVAGQLVSISGIPHIIAGVIEREEGRLAEEAGLSASVAYVSYTTLSQYGMDYGLNTYEIVMPNPVTGYAKNYVAENIGIMENEVDIVENSTRYSLASRFKLLMQFGTRSMNGKAIIYPYWENMARGYEDILGLLLVFMALFFLYPTVLLIILIVIAWKHKTWTAKSVWEKVKDKGERLREKRWAAKKQKKENAEEKKEGKEKPKRERKPKREKKPKQAKHISGKKKSLKDAGKNEEESYEEVE